MHLHIYRPHIIYRPVFYCPIARLNTSRTRAFKFKLLSLMVGEQECSNSDGKHSRSDLLNTFTRTLTHHEHFWTWSGGILTFIEHNCTLMNGYALYVNTLLHVICSRFLAVYPHNPESVLILSPKSTIRTPQSILLDVLNNTDACMLRRNNPYSSFSDFQNVASAVSFSC